jgi:HEAT repeat protein
VADAASKTASPAEPLAPDELRKLIAEFRSYRQNPTPEDIDLLTAYLDHADRLVAAEALNTLAYVARDGVERSAILETFKEKALDKSYALRGKALYMTAMVDPGESLPIIADFISDSQENTRDDSYDAAARALTLHIDSQSLPHLDNLLAKTQDPAVRRICFEILAKIDSPQAVIALQTQIQSVKGEDQTAAVAALARLKDPQVIDFLADSILAEQFDQETIARIAFSTTAPEVFGRLLNSESLTDDRKIELLNTLAEYSVGGNQQLRTEMSDTMASIVQETTNPEIKLRAIHVIGELGAKSAPDILETYLADGDPNVRKEAFFTFMNYTSPYNYWLLRDFIWDEDEQVRRTAMASIAMFVAEDDIEVLTKASQHEDEFIRKHAIALLDQLQ